MSEIALKLTAYFPERERTGSRFLAESMFDLFSERRVATSVMLRGISGFGHQHILRSDQSLSLSEDPSVAIAAVDDAATIGALAGDVVTMTSSGLITLERARLLDGDVTAPPLPEGSLAGDAVKLTVYIGRNRRVNGVPAYRAICELLHRHRFAGVSVFVGVDGTSHGVRRRAHFIGLNVDVPMMIIAIGSAAQVEACSAELAQLLHQPLATTERVRLCKRDGQRLATPPDLPEVDDHGRQLWQKLMVFTSEADRPDGTPIHRALVRALWESNAAAGATVLRGVWGYHGDHKPHGDRLFQLGRRVPVMTVIVGSPASMAGTFRVVDELTAEHGLVTCEMVPALLAVHDGRQRGNTELADFRF